MRCHEGNAAAGGKVGLPVTIPEGLCHVSQLGVGAHGPDEVLVADPARGVIGPRPASDQIDLKAVRCKQQSGPLAPERSPCTRKHPGGTRLHGPVARPTGPTRSPRARRAPGLHRHGDSPVRRRIAGRERLDAPVVHDVPAQGFLVIGWLRRPRRWGHHRFRRNRTHECQRSFPSMGLGHRADSQACRSHACGYALSSVSVCPGSSVPDRAVTGQHGTVGRAHGRQPDSCTPRS